MKCEKCNVEMIDGSLYGKPRFIDIDHDIDKFYVSIKTGKKTSVLGLLVDETKKIKLNVKVCPKCGKVEMYVSPTDIKE
ncbi:MAG: hypothetical protein DBY23_04755 [Bacillota bacterium]|nr:MAG: hypothetical protein DBY23_04755 [Bacillota bacterium]